MPEAPNETAAAEADPSIRRDQAFVAALVLACLLPFLGKPIHLDDPMFLWIAQRIPAHPLRPLDFHLNWEGWSTPAHLIHFSPLAHSYFLALVGAVLGWSEIALHLGMLLPALAFALGVLSLARGLCAHPRLAALLAVATPAFLVSASTLMGDLPMLACWVWAVHFWRRGLLERRLAFLAASGLLVTLAALAKYFGLALLPLLAAYTLAHGRERGWRLVVRPLLALLLPAALCLAYVKGMQHAYRHDFLGFASHYASSLRQGSPWRRFDALVAGLSFAGGCCLPLALWAPWNWRPRGAWVLAGTALALGAAVWVCQDRLDVVTRRGFGLERWDRVAHLFVFAGAGLHFFALVLADLWKRRDADAWLLALWAFGAFAFGAFLNWTINARALLPMLPALALLAVRRAEAREGFANWPAWKRLGPLALGLALSLALLWADFRWAASARDAARELTARHAAPGREVWFHGHWGFQWYMQAGGARPVDRGGSTLAPGDVLVVPKHNASVYAPPEAGARLIQVLEVPVSSGVSVASTRLGAGFYSDVWGALPFAFGATDPDVYEVYQLEEEVKFGE
ncbi:MAG: glycosyltransferase family 39 protein [Planctomycetota bacterium]|nr:glycosyltransferase family 39 protein [Planctomycetota bacterium]